MSALELYVITEYKPTGYTLERIYDYYDIPMVLKFIYDIYMDVNEEVDTLMDRCNIWNNIRDAMNPLNTHVDPSVTERWHGITKDEIGHTYNVYMDYLSNLHELLFTGKSNKDLRERKQDIYNTVLKFNDIDQGLTSNELEQMVLSCSSIGKEVNVVGANINNKVYLYSKTLEHRLERTTDRKTVLLYASTLSLFTEIMSKINIYQRTCQKFLDALARETVRRFVLEKTAHDEGDTDSIVFRDFFGLLSI